MSFKRLAVCVVGLVVTLAGFYQWSFLWRYNISTRGNIVSLTWLDTGSSLLGLNFTESSALMRVRYVVPSGNSFTFVVNYSQSGKAGRPDIAPNSTIPLRYDSFKPQDAIAELDYGKIQTRSILVLMAGGVLFAAGLAAPLLRKKKP